jgi:PadR family transcriptional regulator PadR
LVRVLDALLAEPAQDLFGLEVCRRTHLTTGTVTRILSRLEKEGWVRSWWEDEPVARREGRPRRRFYRLTDEGWHEARRLIRRMLPGVVSPNLGGGAA